MIKTLVLPVLVMMAVVACVELTPAGAYVRVLKEERVAEVSGCQALGQVSVSSEDALRNAAADLAGDTAVMSVRDAGGNFYIRGTIYRCGPESHTSGISTSPFVESEGSSVTVPARRDDAEFAQKSARCEQKGGTWNGRQCVIEID